MQRLQDRCERRHTVWESAGRHQWRLSQLSSQDVTLPLLSDTVHCHPHLNVSLKVVGGWVVHLYDVLGLGTATRSEEHTSELQSRENIVCRLLLEKKK